MSLYERTNTRVRVYSELSDEYEVELWVHQESLRSPFIFIVVVDIVTELA